MNYKSVLEEQIRELQKLQDENVKSSNGGMHKTETAVLLAKQISDLVLMASKEIAEPNEQVPERLNVTIPCEIDKKVLIDLLMRSPQFDLQKL